MKESLKILGNCFGSREKVNPDTGSRNLADSNAPETVRSGIHSRLSRMSTVFERNSKPKEEPKSEDSNPKEKKRSRALELAKTLFERVPKPKNETKTDKEIISDLRKELKEIKDSILRPPIYLVTDFGVGDHAQAECLGEIDKVCRGNGLPSPKIIEAPKVEMFNIYHGSSILNQLASRAGEGSIFVGVVDPGVGSKTREVRKEVVIKTKKGKYLVGPDNGIFTDVILNEGVESSYYINKDEFKHATTFHGRDIFSVAAARISSGIDIASFAQPSDPEDLKKLKFETGSVRHIDTYGNIKLALKEHPNMSALIVGGVRVEVKNSFGDAEEGALLAYIGSSGEGMEIGVNQGNAKDVFKKAKIGKVMTLDWELKDGTIVEISRSKVDSNAKNEKILVA